MKRRVFLVLIKQGFNLLGLVLVACDALSANFTDSLTKKMILESSAFLSEKFIPSQYTCEGQNISLPLAWSEPPVGTKSLALICDDPDAPAKIWVHWVIYNLSPQTRSLPENISSDDLIVLGGIQGINDFGKVTYGGPCPPSGTHRYCFKLYALDQVMALKVGATKAQLEDSMQGHILAQSQLIGRYHRQR
jgi:hypothetical protein